MKPLIVWLLALAGLSACHSTSIQSADGDEPAKVARTNNDNIRTDRKALGFGPDKLSEFGFFTGNLAQLTPAEGVVAYDINMPLFTDYAGKSRFIAVPEGAKVTVAEDGSFRYPEGTRLIKSFHYPTNDQGGRKILETRVIEKTGDDWKALTYIWNDEQTEAYLEVAGGNIDVTWQQAGVLQTVNYSVPNVNQCKTCHGRAGKVQPIGPKVSQLNSTITYPDGSSANQLTYWAQKGILEPLPDSMSGLAFPRWQDVGADNLDQAARAYLDANCGSCHHPEGSANTSGLFLTYDVADRSRYGIMKTPVAAGKGSGGRLYGIVPGKPDESILLFRMQSTDPGVMMPELGRSLTHHEGVALIKRWIEQLPAAQASL